MGPNIIKAEALDNYVIKITLEDNRVAFIDMKPYLEKEIYKALRNITTFNDFEIFHDTIRWCNGASIAPELILENAK